jgi:hypothetical protein
MTIERSREEQWAFTRKPFNSWSRAVHLRNRHREVLARVKPDDGTSTRQLDA